MKKVIERNPVCIKGRNCWQIATAHRASFLIDGASYFEAFARAVERAKHSIYVIGWDIDGRIRLLRDQEQRDLHAELGPLLNTLVARQHGLNVYVLAWDLSMTCAVDRQLLSAIKLGRKNHRRLHFQWDGNHPVGASHHQKIVVVDDAVAFVGGLDLSRCRWDTSEHLAEDPRRVDPGDRAYRPYHNVQLVVDGDAARALGDLARERWRRASGTMPSAVPRHVNDPWPAHLVPDLDNIEVAISRTEAAYKDKPEIREIETLMVDMISAARRHIYIENQYFTSAVIGEALADRLREQDGPEIVIVLPCQTTGWLEEGTMGVLRARLLRRLRDADRFRRLRVYCPVVPGLKEGCLRVHAKVCVIDDRLVRIGSSNLNNRSMGLDSECDLAIEDHVGSRARESIIRFRNRLLSEHLGTSLDKIGAAIKSTNSLSKAIDALRGGERTLQPLDVKVPERIDQIIPGSGVVGAERANSAEKLLKEFVPEEIQESRKYQFRRTALVLAALLAIAAAWLWTPLADWVDLRTLTHWAARVKGDPTGPIVVLAAYLVGGLVMFPVTLLIVATAFTFGPVLGFIYSLAGCLLSAALNYGVGCLVGRDLVDRIAGSNLSRVLQIVRRHGLMAVVTLRVTPMAPFSITSMVAGASRLRFTNFMLGTFLGKGPGIFVITVFEHQLENAIRDPRWGSFALLAALMLASGIMIIWIRRGLAFRWTEDNGKTA
ncbi:MAG: VTT domain-containing protein [Acidobacteriota bacterium]